jgi:hypothetical protein
LSQKPLQRRLWHKDTPADAHRRNLATLNDFVRKGPADTEELGSLFNGEHQAILNRRYGTYATRRSWRGGGAGMARDESESIS